MRRLLGILFFLCLCWCGWWAILGWGMKTGLATWFEHQRQNGWQAEYADIALSGFPMRAQTQMNDVVLSDTKAGIVLNWPQLNIAAPTLRPSDLRLDFPDEPISFVTFQSKTDLSIKDGQAKLSLHPGAALELSAMEAMLAGWEIASDGQNRLEAGPSVFQMTQVDGNPQSYDFNFSIQALSPGEVIRAHLNLPSDWAVSFDSLDLRAKVEFDRPWDITAIEKSRPQPRHIMLDLAEAKWEDLRLFFAADLKVDANGTPEGDLHIQAENWQTMLDLAQSSQFLSPSIAQQAQGILSTLAQLSGDPNALDVKLTLKGGLAFFGILPIGPAPKIKLR